MLQKLCCMQLKTAGIVIGWIGVVISSLRIVQLLYSLIAIYHNSMAAAHTFLWLTSLVFLVLAVLDLIASGLLIAGTKQERHSMVLLWLIDAVIRVIITNLFSVIWYIMLFSDNKNGNDAHEKIFIFTTLVTLALEIYVFCGIYALYNQIKLSNSQIRSTTAQQPAYPNVEYKNNFNV